MSFRKASDKTAKMFGRHPGGWFLTVNITAALDSVKLDTDITEICD